MPGPTNPLRRLFVVIGIPVLAWLGVSCGLRRWLCLPCLRSCRSCLNCLTCWRNATTDYRSDYDDDYRGSTYRGSSDRSGYGKYSYGSRALGRDGRDNYSNLP